MADRRVGIVFRVDASIQIGVGHVMRCLTLADELRRAGARCLFVVRDTPGHASEEIQRQGFEVRMLVASASNACGATPHASWLGGDVRGDAESTAACAVKWAASWVVVDHYALDADWEAYVALHAGCRVAVVDDLADRPHRCDLLIDHNAGHVPSLYEKWPIGRLLCGARFALLRPQFGALRAQAARRRDQIDARSILVFMGGLDAPNVTQTVLDALEAIDAPPGGRLVVVMGGKSPALAQIGASLARHSWPAELRVDVQDMAALMLEADIAIGAAGGAAWERCCVGLPSIVIQCADNQSTVMTALESAEAALTIRDVSVQQIAQTTERLLVDSALRKRLGRNAMNLIDGAGARRVAVTLCMDRLDLRMAREVDAEAVLEWRNAADTRRYSRDPRLIDRTAHLEWWSSRLSDTTMSLLIGHLGDIDVGVLRLDRTADQAEISIYLDPHLHGLGLGVRMIELGFEWASQHDGKLSRLVAEIHPDNVASLKAFQAAGFVRDATGLWMKELLR